MKFVKITVDGVVYNLMQLEDGTWVVTNRAPLSAGEYVMTITVVTEAGQEITIDTTDEELLKAVTLLVENGSTESGRRMLDYYPWVIKIILEFQAIIFSEGFEIDFLKSDVRMAVNDAWLLTMGELRIAEWENLLHLTPGEDETIEDRRDKIIATLRGKGKLNTALINSIVGAYTNGGTAESYIKDSVLYVKVNPPVGNKSYKFANVENTLKPLVPAHIGLSVSRNYATWGEIKENFASWDAVSKLDNWEELNLWLAPV
jgi:hypothetical protein